MRLAVLSSHPIQYYAPMFREMASRFDVEVMYAHQATPTQQASAGFDVPFQWDFDLLDGYSHRFLQNVASKPGVDHFRGCDTPTIGAELDKNGFDALLLTGWNLKTYIQGLFAAKRRRIPVLVRGDSNLATRRSAPKHAAKRIVYPLFLRLFDAALYVGARSRAYYLHYGYPSDRLFFSPHCVDNDFFASRASVEARRQLRAKLGVGVGTGLLLFAGKLVPFKRPLDLIHAVDLLRRAGRDVAVLVAGSGPLENEMSAVAEELGVPLHLLGFQNQTQMPTAYIASDALVLPSSGRETWGLVCNEAIACGTPIIVSDEIGCAPDLAQDTGVGRVFPCGDVAALATAAAELLRAPPSAEALRAISNAYSIGAAVDGLERTLAALKAIER